jgi:hypothetical protein
MRPGVSERTLSKDIVDVSLKLAIEQVDGATWVNVHIITICLNPSDALYPAPFTRQSFKKLTKSWEDFKNYPAARDILQNADCVLSVELDNCIHEIEGERDCVEDVSLKLIVTQVDRTRRVEFHIIIISYYPSDSPYKREAIKTFTKSWEDFKKDSMARDIVLLADWKDEFNTPIRSRI